MWLPSWSKVGRQHASRWHKRVKAEIEIDRKMGAIDATAALHDIVNMEARKSCLFIVQRVILETANANWPTRWRVAEKGSSNWKVFSLIDQLFPDDSDWYMSIEGPKHKGVCDIFDEVKYTEKFYNFPAI